MAKGAFPTCMLKHTKRKEHMVNSYISDIRSEALVNIATKIKNAYNITLDRAMEIASEEEYYPVLMDEMLRLHEERKKI